MITKIYKALLSLNTLFWLFSACITIFLIGSLMLPSNLSFFSGIDDSPLFAWLRDSGDITKTWWIYALVASIGVLALSTAACTLDALMSLDSLKNSLPRVSVQAMHIGLMLVLSGEFLTASFGVREDILIKQGQTTRLKTGARIALVDLSVKTDINGYYSDWIASLKIGPGEGGSAITVLRPLHPVGAMGRNLFFKSINMEEQTALIGVSKDPGAVWALAGGILIVLSASVLLYIKSIRRPTA